MFIIKTILLVIEALCCVMLIGIILMQKSKSEGLGLSFGGGMGETLFGSRAGNVLTKITITLAVVFLTTTTLLAVVLTKTHEATIMESRVGTAVPTAPQAAPSTVGGPIEAPAPQGPAPTLLPGSSLEDQPAASAPVAVEAPAAAPAAPAPENPQP